MPSAPLNRLQSFFGILTVVGLVFFSQQPAHAGGDLTGRRAETAADRGKSGATKSRTKKSGRKRSSSSVTGSVQTIDFNREIRPILSDNCFKCHGPDKTNRKGELRIDTQAGIFSKREDGRMLVSGKPSASVLFRRISSRDADVKMPPPDSDRTLSAVQIALIKRWIEQGAKWQKHWSFIPPVRPALPHVNNRKWVRNPIDAFVLSRLEAARLVPSRQADRTTLIRRVTLDLTGLPPTLREVDAFLADKSATAYEKVVDRLLRSKRFGEKMAVHWLDAARFADTSGYQNDGPRDMWRYRDWVIDAFNANKPYDQFTLEQIAGDMLPQATLDQKIATAFNRNHRGNAEGGIIPEEFQVEYVVDRVETTFTVFQGLTMGCARCHEHKFDPISQKEFYRLFAYFNNIPENGRAVKEGNSPPYIKAPTWSQQKQLARLQRNLAAAKLRFQKMQSRLKLAQTEWERTFDRKERVDYAVTDGLIAHFSFDGDLKNRAKPASGEKTRPNETPPFVSGRFKQAVSLDGKRFVDAGLVADFGYFDKFSFGAWVFPTKTGSGTILSKMTDIAQGDGYSLLLDRGKIQVNLVKRWLDDSIRIGTVDTIPANRWSHVFVSYDGSRVAKGIRVFVNGKPWRLQVHLDGINQSFANSKQPLRIGGGGGLSGRFQGKIDDVRIYNRTLSPVEVAIVSTPATISKIVLLPAEKRTSAEAAKLRAHFLTEAAPLAIRKAYRDCLRLKKQTRNFVENLPTVMIMQEGKIPRPTFVLKRGVYNKPGDRVTPGVPQSLSPLPRGVPNNRLGFARWLVDRSNPLTARVAVNRFWQMLFGVGLVKTAEDFGSQGEQPSHPQLLDWLAVEFRDSGWNIKRLLKTIVISATYRQSSSFRQSSPFKQSRTLRVRSGLAQPGSVAARDPENRLLARGPRFRMPAEMIRDQALAISGLLSEKIGGPSVKPYQPAGLWKEIATVGDYQQSHGSALYRRSLYTYWKRTVSPPTMAVFDASARESCAVRRARTNTPLQALTLLNEVTFVEAARVLAETAMTRGGGTPASRITFLFRRATGRRPRAAELKILSNGFQSHLKKYNSDRQAAKKLISSGEAPRNEKLDAAELAAYTTIASLILNLDEVVTKE